MGADEIDFDDRESLEKSVSNDGTVTLGWAGREGGEVVLERARSRDFGDPLVIYRGTDPGSVVTGLEEGEHYFRIRSGAGEHSEPLRIRVEFVSRVRLAILLSLGGVVVIATVLAIVLGNLKTRRGEGGGRA